MKHKTNRSQLSDHSSPNDADAERAVLAVVLLEPRRFGDMTTTLEPADFADEINRIIFEAMLRLQTAGKPIDATLLVGELRDRGQYNAESGVSAATLVELFRLLPLACHLDHYVARVAEMSRRSGNQYSVITPHSSCQSGVSPKTVDQSN